MQMGIHAEQFCIFSTRRVARKTVYASTIFIYLQNQQSWKIEALNEEEK